MAQVKMWYEILRYQREVRGWSQKRVADQLGTDENTVNRWECGKRKPGPYYREEFQALYGMSVQELGFIEPLEIPGSSPSGAPPLSSGHRAPPGPSVPSIDRLLPEHRETSMSIRGQSFGGMHSPQGKAVQSVVPERERPAGASASIQPEIPTVILQLHPGIDILFEKSDARPEQQREAWQALLGGDVARLFDLGWSLDEVLDAQRILFKEIEAMPQSIRNKISRRALLERFLELVALAAVGSIPIPTGEHVSLEERVQLCRAFGENIAAGWKQFHTAGNAQVLAIGQAQLSLLQQVSAYLFPNVRLLCYSGVYNLIGAAQHFQGHYDEAYQHHERAYIAALEGADVLTMAQSRTWQANGLRAQERYSEALEMIEAALRLIWQRNDTESIRLRSHLLASAAENAALLGETHVMDKHLDASEALLEKLPLIHTEEFDHASWHQYAGTCALILKRYDQATEELERALDTLPPGWIVRRATALMPLAIAYARSRDRERCLATAQTAAQVVKAMNAASLNREFVGYLEQEIVSAFLDDAHISTFVTDIRQQLILTNALTRMN